MDNLYNNTPGVIELKTADLVKKPDGTVLVGRPEFRGKVHLLAFYAPWCGHCVRMVSDVKQLAGALKDEGFIVGAVNCEANKDDLDKKIEINSFPTLFFVKDDKAEKYDGPRDLQSMLTFLCDRLGKCVRRK